MNASRTWSCKRLLGSVGAGAALAAGFFLAPAPAAADPPPNVDMSQVARVEEDWALTVTQPNSAVASPQVSTQMARSPWASRFCNFHLNSVDVPSFALGGLQLQAWKGGTNLAVYTSPNSAIMSTDPETVQWTQYLRTSNGQLYFGVGTVSQPNAPGLTSQTWGNITSMEINVPNSSANLSNYDPSYSWQNSGVTYGANRVKSMVLVQVRYYDASNNLLGTQLLNQVIYSQVLDPALSGGDS